MREILIIVMLMTPLMLSAPQAGRHREEPPSAPTDATTPVKTDTPRPVLVNMTPDEFDACGLKKLSEEELNRLDRWFLQLLVKLQSLPKERSLTFDRSGEASTGRTTAESRQRDLELQVQDLESRLAIIRRETTRMSFDITQARLAASRGDWSSLTSTLHGLETSLRQIERASQ
ncbi:MAG: hypothetical protein RMM98_13535 [Acidobacteriota bacterium]|nr:hypothetical protein [Blastocatellia bacterium]MDW8240626.1 hypothetical protein [Acidobacteriota bacterium]